jgi:hypothetical protein
MEDDEEQGVGSEHCSGTSGDVLDAKTSYVKSIHEHNSPGSLILNGTRLVLS